MAGGSHDGESKVATLLAIFKGLLVAPTSAKNSSSNAKVTQLLAPVARSGVESPDKKLKLKLSMTPPGCTSASKAKANKSSTEHTPLLRKRFFSDAGLSSSSPESNQKLFGFSKTLLKGESGFLFTLAVQMVRVSIGSKLCTPNEWL